MQQSNMEKQSEAFIHYGSLFPDEIEYIDVKNKAFRKKCMFYRTFFQLWKRKSSF